MRAWCDATSDGWPTSRKVGDPPGGASEPPMGVALSRTSWLSPRAAPTYLQAPDALASAPPWQCLISMVQHSMARQVLPGKTLMR